MSIVFITFGKYSSILFHGFHPGSRVQSDVKTECLDFLGSELWLQKAESCKNAGNFCLQQISFLICMSTYVSYFRDVHQNVPRFLENACFADESKRHFEV